MPGGRFYGASDHICQHYLTAQRIKAVYVHMVHALVCHQQVFIVMGHPGAVDMGPEIPLCHTSQPLVENLIRNLPDGSIIIQCQHCQLSIMIAGHKEISVCIVGRQIASPHAIDGCKIDHGQIPVPHDPIGFHTEIRDGIQILIIVGDCHIGRIGNLHLILLPEMSLLHIHIIDSDTMLVPLCISAHIRHIFFLFHRHTSLCPSANISVRIWKLHFQI